MRKILKPEGVIVLEFPHLLNMIKETLFDTIYHEHFSYLALGTVKSIFRAAGLRIWDVEKIQTHGGSLRIYGCRVESNRIETLRVEDLIKEEIEAGLFSTKAYENFESESHKIKNQLREFLFAKRENGKIVIAYGAAAKGNTLLNFAGIESDLISYVVDASTAKQGLYLPGSHIPIYAPEKMLEGGFESILILPWNLSAEICSFIKQDLKITAAIFSAIPKIRFY